MNKIRLLLITLALVSCQEEIVSEEQQLTLEISDQAWQLVEIQVGMTGELIAKPELTYSESYTLYADQTFIKRNVSNGNLQQAKGTYTIESTENEKYFRLMYETDNVLIQNCSSQPEEYLIIRDNRLVNANASACDGPYLIYEKAATTD